MTMVVDPGTTATATITAVDGLTAILSLTDNSPATAQTIVVRMTGVDILPGYAAQAARIIDQQIHPGQMVLVTWIGMHPDGLPMTLLEPLKTMPSSGTIHALQALSSSPLISIDRMLLSAGIAVPRGEAAHVPVVRTQYAMWLRDAARQNHGAWSDAASSIRASSSSWLASDSIGLHPTFFAANAGFCVLFGLVIGAAVLLSMAQERQTPPSETSDADAQKRKQPRMPHFIRLLLRPLSRR